MKLKEKLRAIRLRKKGKSYKEIQKNISVSKSTLSIWLRDIKLTPLQEKRIYVELRQKNAYRLAKANQRERIRKTGEIIKTAKKEIPSYLRDPLFLAGLMLYWAEGDKSDESEVVKFSNSDPEMIRFMMKWFRKICKIPERKFRIALHIHELHCRKNIENYWSKLTNISRNQFHKTQIKPTSLGQRKNILYNGTCAIRISDKNLFRKIKGWKLGFLEMQNKMPR
ncbi:MAG: hypothetical protein A2V69_02765 [Candidatus Portnoybacteria bacterium RBG_13_40_8]|uniref:Uncharacterized protein n=1 Tax=Candidatus Portnoybacteria bacterium RBG_13_40_8 TaxID=1801990 RepID=A0A1G2F652_9BACT|nr:MAG: hypothetical protein A2V69_02765 [Candidatus Portnoybacteria bacterium RBG_13_40_8]OGZ35446.1 MAG: hypothetical protein A2V60_03345 [Candidatus Portnoybacteria bacterium RIFCSPHIGHO2_01_FULL_39_19]